jgi:hypothetical protein
LKAEAPGSLNALAWLLATCPDDTVRDGKQAVELATRACERTKWKDANIISTLAAAHAAAGNFEKAIEYEKRALADEWYEKNKGEDARKRLKLFAEKKPYLSADGQ